MQTTARESNRTAAPPMMRQERKDLLDDHIQQFTRHLKVNEIVDKLIFKRVINQDVGDRIIDSRRSESDRRKAVVTAVKTRGDTAFDRFYEALLEAGHVDLAALLEPLLRNDANHYSSENVPLSPTRNDYRVRRATSPSVYCSPPPPRERRESVSSISSITSTYQDVVARARSRSRSSRVHMSERSIYTSPVMSFSRQPTSANSSFNGGSLGYSSGRRAPEYIFNEESMNYVDSPHINRVFDERTMYRNFSNPRGLCLIINNEHFGQMPSRNGTKADRDNLMNLFRCMGYQVICKENLAAREMLGAVREFAKYDHGDSAILVILSHGEDNVIIGVDDISVSILELTDCLNATNAPRLANKPKLFFIQACRGERRDTGFPVLDATDGVAITRRHLDEHDSPLLKFLGGCVRPQPQRAVYRKKPNQADMLIAYATTAQYVSWRNSVRGSWFIQAVCEVFSEHAGDMDVFELLTEVNNRVACGFHTSQGSNILKQMPETTSRLLKKFYFWPRRNSSV